LDPGGPSIFSGSCWLERDVVTRARDYGMPGRNRPHSGNQRRESKRKYDQIWEQALAHGEPAAGVLPLDPLRAFAIAFVDNENVGDFHDARLDGLHIIAHPRDQDDNGNVGQAHNINFILADSDGFHQHQIFSAGIEHGGHVGGGARQATEKSAGSHAANVNSGVGVVRLHADAVPQDGAAGVRTGGIDGDNSHGLVLLAIVPGQLVHQSALARAPRTGVSDDAGAAAIGKPCFQQLVGLGSRIFDCVAAAGYSPWYLSVTDFIPRSPA